MGNVKGKPVVCSRHEALRTFFATGMGALALDSLLMAKPAMVGLSEDRINF